MYATSKCSGETRHAASSLSIENVLPTISPAGEQAIADRRNRSNQNSRALDSFRGVDAPVRH
jgi:hypothetical protein